MDAVDELLQLDLVRPTEVPRRFRFRHPLVRRAVYETTAAGWRLGAHERCADALAARGASAAVRAHHVERSAREGDAAAVAVLREAGESAVRLAPESAARWFGDALRLLPQTAPADERIELLVARSGALTAAGHFGESHEALLEAVALAPRRSAARPRLRRGGRAARPARAGRRAAPEGDRGAARPGLARSRGAHDRAGHQPRLAREVRGDARLGRPRGDRRATAGRRAADRDRALRSRARRNDGPRARAGGRGPCGGGRDRRLAVGRGARGPSRGADATRRHRALPRPLRRRRRARHPCTRSSTRNRPGRAPARSRADARRPSPHARQAGRVRRVARRRDRGVAPVRQHARADLEPLRALDRPRCTWATSSSRTRRRRRPSS